MRDTCIRTGVILVFLALTGLGCESRVDEANEEERLIGVKIYENERALPALFEEWKALGINTVFASVELSTLDEFRALANAHDISLFLILPTFFNPEALDADSSLYAITDRGEKAVEEWVRFVCPSRQGFRRQYIERVKQLITDLDPDGLSIDFIRHFVFWEKVYPERTLTSLPNTCFDSFCLRKFQTDTGIALPDTTVPTPDIAGWITEYHLQEWTDWKSRLITGMVEEVARQARQLNPDIVINVHAVPWREDDFGGAIKIVAGQDLADLAPYVDFLSPMTYAHMVKRGPAWVHSVVEDIHRRARGKVIPSIQVRRAYLADTLTVETFSATLVEALRAPSQGVVFWSWEALEQDPEKKAVLPDLIRQGVLEK